MDLYPRMWGILAVFALLAFTLWCLKKKGTIRMAAVFPVRWSGQGQRGEERLLERIDGLRLSPTHSLSLIRMADRAILIGISPGGFCLVESTPWKPIRPGSAQEFSGQKIASREQIER
jgi:Flagellar biosynthesis protein, FliO